MMKILKWQQQLLQDNHQFVAVVGGYGCAKTFCLALFVVTEMLQYPKSFGTIYINTRPQGSTTVVTQIQKAFDMMKIPFTYNKVEGVFTLGNGSVAKVQTLQVPIGELKGVENDWAVMDEADVLMDDQKWDYVKARIRGQNGSRKFRVFANPPSWGHWIARDFTGSTQKPDHHFMQISTFANKFLPPDVVQTYKNTYKEGTPHYRKWMLGEIVALEGAVYPEFNPAIHVVDDVPKTFRAYVHGLDLGSRDPSVLIGGGLDDAGRLWIIDEYYSEPMTSPQEQALAIKNHRLGDGNIWSDHSLTMRLAFEHEGVYTIPADKDRDLGHTLVRNRIRDGFVKIKRGAAPNLERELQLYRYKDTGIKEDTEHKYSHAPDALRYLIVGIDAGSITPDEARQIYTSLGDF